MAWDLCSMNGSERAHLFRWQGVAMADRTEPASGRWAPILPSDRALRLSIVGVLFGPSLLLVVALVLALTGDWMNALLVLVLCSLVGFIPALKIAVIARELSRRRRGEEARQPDFDWRDTGGGTGKSGRVHVALVAVVLLPFIYGLFCAALLLIDDNIAGAIAVALCGSFMLLVSLQGLYLRRREL